MKRLPGTVLALGFVSLFMDISSEMIHSLLPIFLLTVLQVNTVVIGLIEGSAEAVALITKTFSGVVSDRMGKRKPLVFLGYALGALTKPFFALANGPAVVFGARVIDRIGKGLRGAPRDALIADVTDISNRGAAYGLRQSLDTMGAFLGPLLAAGLMLLTHGNFRFVFWIALFPGLTAAAIVTVAVKEPKIPGTAAVRGMLRWKEAGRLGHSFWLVMMFGAVFNLARFSEAFLLLRAQNIGVAAAAIPLILVLMNVVYSLTAYPAGFLSDRIGSRGLMTAGLISLIMANIVFFQAESVWDTALGAALWGLHLGLTQGLLSALVATTAPTGMRGTAFGFFGLISGLAALCASFLAGLLWKIWGPAITFLAGAAVAGMALIGYSVMSWQRFPNTASPTKKE